MSRFCKTIASM